ncbi:deoxyribodipyrimidine photolyase-related protein [Microlunatus sagamiharensis]|uniref:Deoxyribodipyrimidine photolyase-related protein n=1 Tax=Microlunatus sagamiharensis TaxID=546874 RepID=A0A1H2LG04_9ACTN|nr:cryptochrome/photolyase family protein [Microlunatus sagamiharensis]SDU79754.1 deoxyribodipyrimidine photolyase-related protein [Microlunatus sagamiharensis]
MTESSTRWLFGDQLGDYFLDDDDQQVVLVESRRVFRRRRFHRQKAHLVLSAMRHRAAELGERCTYLVTETYREALEQVEGPLSVVQPTTWAALHLVDTLVGEREIERLPARGYVTGRGEFGRWADGRGRRRLLMENFYRDARTRNDVLMKGAEPVEGRWNFDADNREPPPRSGRLDIPEPWWPEEDEIDAAVRADLDAMEADGIEFVGEDGPRRFAASSAEAQAALDHFVEHRLPTFGRYEDAMLTGDRWMAHSLISAPLNLGLLDPLAVVRTAEEAYVAGEAPISAVEGFVRQVMGWRDYIWNLYWYLGEDYRNENALKATTPLPEWFTRLDPTGTDARCLSWSLSSVREVGWAHHIPRLMVIGNYAQQRGWDPQELTDWFHRSFVDGYGWVMVPNVVGMSQYADDGVLGTKPYVGGGAYINRMSDFCGDCVYDPKKRTGEDACPFTVGYWGFLHRNREHLSGNFRMGQVLRNLDRLKDLDQLLEENPEFCA